MSRSQLRAREDDDADADGHQAALRSPSDEAPARVSMAYASMSGLASSSAARRSTTARAAASSAASTVSSTRRPTRTALTPLDPEVAEAALDGPALRIEDARLGRDVDGEPVGAHRAMTSSAR